MLRAKLFIVAVVVAVATNFSLCWSQVVSPGDRLRVVSPARIKIGQQVLATVPAGTEVVAVQVNGDWIYVETSSGNGWIHRTRVERVAEAEPDDGGAPPPPESESLLDLLGSYLRKMGLRYAAITEPEEREGIIVFGFKFEEGFTIEVIIDPIVEKRCLRMTAPRLFFAPQTPGSEARLLELLKAIGFINYSHNVGRFSYDPRDGEVAFDLNMPLVDISIPYSMFEHCLLLFLAQIRDKVPRLKDVWEGRCGADVFYQGGIIRPSLRTAPTSGVRTASLPAALLRREQEV